MLLTYPGEHVVNHENAMLATITGICLVVILYHQGRGIAGMGHFIVPGIVGTADIHHSEITSYAITQMEYLFGEFVKKGVSREQLEASVFGAANTDGTLPRSEALIRTNISFIEKYLRDEGVSQKTMDVGGAQRRKIMIDVSSGRIWGKFLVNNHQESESLKLEKEYITRAFAEKDAKTRYIEF